MTAAVPHGEFQGHGDTRGSLELIHQGQEDLGWYRHVQREEPAGTHPGVSEGPAVAFVHQARELVTQVPALAPGSPLPQIHLYKHILAAGAQSSCPGQSFSLAGTSVSLWDICAHAEALWQSRLHHALSTHPPHSHTVCLG